MSAKSISNNSSDHKSGDAMGRLLMVFLSIIAATAIIIGLWAALTGGGFN